MLNKRQFTLPKGNIAHLGIDLSQSGITDPENQYVDRKSAARILGQEENTLAVWAATKRYKLPFYKVGRKRVVYKVADLLRFIEKGLQE